VCEGVKIGLSRVGENIIPAGRGMVSCHPPKEDFESAWRNAAKRYRNN
jgi:hypothetical protein